MSESPNRRRFSRIGIALRVELDCEDGKRVYESTRDLGLKGVFVATDTPLEIDMECQAELILGQGENALRLETKARVARRDSQGMGLEFLGVDVESFEHLRNLLRYNSPDADAIEHEFDDSRGILPRE
ncbi:MAG: PilZ domain protein [candidate division BRC1 bacterium ADurb.BinA364]|nr:MAG: PilZ domain protein [candidate division BRC1 bacterium ADurb.BinA364]